MNRVNPPKQVVLPPEVQSNPQLKKAFDDAYFIMFQMWKRLGGGEDWIDDNRTTGYEFDDLSPFISVFLPNPDDVVSTTENYLTIGNQIIICNDDLTVMLNSEPKDRETAKIKIANGDVTIEGNGRMVDNETDITIDFDNIQGLAVIDVIYTIETDSWWVL